MFAFDPDVDARCEEAGARPLVREVLTMTSGRLVNARHPGPIGRTGAVGRKPLPRQKPGVMPGTGVSTRWISYLERRKRPVIANVAIARELSGWCLPDAATPPDSHTRQQPDKGCRGCPRLAELLI